MNYCRLTKLILGIFLLCLACILIIYKFLLSSPLRDALIAEIVGGGIFGCIVAAAFFYLQESNEYRASKTRALSFFNNKLILDINEAADRNLSFWNLSGGNKFYFDGSRINPLFDVYQANYSEIENYLAYFPDDELINKYSKFYRLARKGYVYGEKLDNLVNQFVRARHHKLGLITANDPPAKAYVKAKLFANLPTKEIIKHLEWKAVPERTKLLSKQISKNKEVINLANKLKKLRKSLVKLEGETIKMAKKRS